MSLAFSAPLQAALYARLTGDAGVTALVGSAVHDALPPGIPPPLYLLLGPEEVQTRPDSGGAVAQHDLTVSVITEAAGFSSAKVVADAVCTALTAAPLALGGGRMAPVALHHARARRLDQGALREIRLTFRARLDLPL